jgi:hypothetical protein
VEGLEVLAATGGMLLASSHCVRAMRQMSMSEGKNTLK